MSGKQFSDCRKRKVRMMSLLFLLVAVAVSTVVAQPCVAPIGVRNLAKYGKVSQSSSYSANSHPQLAIDGNNDSIYSQGSCTHTKKDDKPWWRLEMDRSERIGVIAITNRKDCCQERLKGVLVTVGDSPDHNNPVCAEITDVTPNKITVCCNGMPGRFVTIINPRPDYMTLCEVEVFRNIEQESLQLEEEEIKPESYE
ncbi:fucolectin-6-like [Pelobates fuscus]|uniref:fucolectin-6-like n=1 Tax=Pelobates fuscus TaxID=191477 RepID=UPI002FE489A9